jgi:hypothetical protein
MDRKIIFKEYWNHGTAYALLLDDLEHSVYDLSSQKKIEDLLVTLDS